MNAPKQLHFDLFFREANISYFWSLTPGGITLDAEGISWRGARLERRYRYADLKSVHLRKAVGGKSGFVYFCTLRFRDGGILTIFSSDSRGQFDEQKHGIYAEFMRILHARLDTLKPEGVDYLAGQNRVRYAIALGAVILLTCMLVVLPFVLIFVAGWEAIVPLVAGSAFTFGMWKLVLAGKPRRYTPDAVPDDVVP